MKRESVVMYSTGIMFDRINQTGGVKRFVELTGSLNNKFSDTILYTRDEENVAKLHGIKNFKRLKRAKKLFCFLPLEFAILLSNLSAVKELKKNAYRKVVVFDVPPAIGLMLCGVANIVLMIRKDLIGYEKVQNKSKLKWLKICFLWFCESICMARANLIITQCVYDKEVLKKRHPLLATRIEKKTIIQINNVNPSWIVGKSRESIGSDSNLCKEGFRVCFVGGFDNPRKGQDLFLAAASEILKESKDVYFVLIGGGRKWEEYKIKYNNDNISFLGRQENPIKILKQCDLLVVPSYADSCPNTVMEALYNNVPVIGSRAGGIPEILNNEDSLFELDSNSLRTKILQLKNSETSLQNLKDWQKSRKIELTFDWADKIIDKL